MEKTIRKECGWHLEIHPLICFYCWYQCRCWFTLSSLGIQQCRYYVTWCKLIWICYVKISTLWNLTWWPFDYHLHDCLERIWYLKTFNTSKMIGFVNYFDFLSGITKGGKLPKYYYKLTHNKEKFKNTYHYSQQSIAQF